MKQNTFIYAAIAFFVCSSCTSGKYSPVDYVDPLLVQVFTVIRIRGQLFLSVRYN